MAEIGSTLREARMRARIDISEVEARTKIRAKYLRAIENEEWDLLPGTVYVKSFLRTYGDFLGLDSRLLLDEFKRRYERPDDHELRSMASGGRERERRPSRRARVAGGSRSPLVVIGVALVVIVVALYVIGSHTGGGTPTSSGNITPSGGKHHTTGHGHGKGAKPGKGKGKGKGKSKGSSVGQGKTNTGTNTNTTPTTPTEATLTIKPTNTVWVCVADPTGTPLIDQNFLAGASVPAEHGSELLVVLGNANADLTVNGKPYPLTSSASVISLQITPTAVKPVTSVSQCK